MNSNYTYGQDPMQDGSGQQQQPQDPLQAFEQAQMRFQTTLQQAYEGTINAVQELYAKAQMQNANAQSYYPPGMQPQPMQDQQQAGPGQEQAQAQNQGYPQAFTQAVQQADEQLRSQMETQREQLSKAAEMMNTPMPGMPTMPNLQHIQQPPVMQQPQQPQQPDQQPPQDGTAGDDVIFAG